MIPSNRELDELLMPALATTAELAAVHYDCDGVATPCVALMVEVPIESSGAEFGVVVTGSRNDIVIQKAQVPRPACGDMIVLDETWLLLRKEGEDSSVTQWSVVRS